MKHRKELLFPVACCTLLAAVLVWGLAPGLQHTLSSGPAAAGFAGGRQHPPTRWSRDLLQADAGSSSQMPWGWTWRDLLSLLCVAINSITAAATGQGGSQILIPIFTALLLFPINQAVAVSAFTQFLGSLPSLYHAAIMPHPYDSSTTLIDYATMAVCMPVMLVGIKLGVMVNKLSPAWFVSWLMIAVFIWSTIQCYFSYVRLRRKEASKAQLMNKLETEMQDLEAAVAATLPASQQHMLSEVHTDMQKIAHMSHDVMIEEAATGLPPDMLHHTANTHLCAALDRQGSAFQTAATASFTAHHQPQNLLQLTRQLTEGSTCSRLGSMRALQVIFVVEAASRGSTEPVPAQEGANKQPDQCSSSTGHSSSLKQRLADWRSSAAVWGTKQPVLLQVMLAVSLMLYVGMCIAENLLPKCSGSIYIAIALFAAFSLLLTLAAAWLQWRAHKSSAAQQHCCWQQQQQQGQVSACKAAFNTSIANDSSVIVIPSVSSSSGKCPAQPGAAAEASSPCKPVQANSSSWSAVPAAAAAPAAPVPDFSDIQWTPKRLMYWPAMMVLIGAISGLLGMSPGGVFLTPMWLRMGQHPQVTSATVKLLLFASTGSSAIGYLLNGQLNISYGLAFGITNLLTTPIGQHLMDRWIARSGAPSLLVMSNIVRNVIGVGLLVWINGVPGVMDLIHGTNVGFTSPHACR